MTQPGSIGNIVPRNDGWFGAELRKIWAAIRGLQTARAGNAMTIDGKPGLTISGGGNVKVKDGGSFGLYSAAGDGLFYAGQLAIPDGSGRTQQAVLFARGDGTTAFAVADLGTAPGHAYQPALANFDRAGNTIFAEDAISGSGLARPYLPAGAFVDITPPTATTTSTAYTSLQWADCYQQHPKVTCSVLVNTAAGTTGTIRLLISGQQIGAAVSIPANSFGVFTIDPAAWPAGTYAFEQRVTVELQARTTAGAGAIGVRSLGFWGVQS